MPTLFLAAAATSAELMPGQFPVVVRYRPQKSGLPRIEATCGYRPLAPLASPVIGLHESTPHRIRVGCTQADRTWMFPSGAWSATLWSSWSAMVGASTAAGTVPITAEKYGVAPPISVTRALQAEPVLQGLSTS